MRRLALAAFLLAGIAAADATPAPPLADGDHRFMHRYAEHENAPRTPVIVRIAGEHVQVIAEADSDVFPRGVIDEGPLFLHASGRWIIVHDPADRTAAEVGGCTDVANVIDFATREYWTC